VLTERFDLDQTLLRIASDELVTPATIHVKCWKGRAVYGRSIGHLSQHCDRQGTLVANWHAGRETWGLFVAAQTAVG
jgi:hypothetical protein